jgi:hypothetical protein
MAGIIQVSLKSMRQAEFSALSLAANSLALQRLEQTRAANWDPMNNSNIDFVVSSNFPADVELLDVPMNQTNQWFATNFTTIQLISSNPPLKVVRVDCVWRFANRGLFTNTLVTYRAPRL